jgi:hypothetical protein
MNLVDLLKKNIVMVPVVASVLVGTFTGVKYIVIAKLERAEGTWEMAENLYEVLADKVRQMEYDIKDLNREINY